MTVNDLFYFLNYYYLLEIIYSIYFHQMSESLSKSCLSDRFCYNKDILQMSVSVI